MPGKNTPSVGSIDKAMVLISSGETGKSSARAAAAQAAAMSALLEAMPLPRGNLDLIAKEKGRAEPCRNKNARAAAYDLKFFVSSAAGAEKFMLTSLCHDMGQVISRSPPSMTPCANSPQEPGTFAILNHPVKLSTIADSAF
jgi:hypothetical protein